jgi:branched-chain amino acid transport system substrate-binding protein
MVGLRGKAMRVHGLAACAAVMLMVGFSGTLAAAEKKYDPGVSDTEIKLGGTGPFSGPVSVAGSLVKSVAAYFTKVNADGGINGRTVTYLTEDDGYVPPKAVEVTRKLVEQDQVLLMVGSIGTPGQLAVRRYLNDRKIPQLFIATGSTGFYQPDVSPWTLGNSVTYYGEGRLIAKHIDETMSAAKVAILFQNDDFGRDYLRGVEDGIADKAKIARQVSYEVTDPTVDSQIATLKSSGAEILIALATPKAASQAIRRAYDTGWKPKIFIPSAAAQIEGVLLPAGFEKSIGVISASFRKDPADPRWEHDPEMVAFLDWKKTYNSGVTDMALASAGYDAARLMADILKECGDELTRENVMKHATNLRDRHTPLMLPGILLNTTPTDYRIVRQMQFQRFNGKNWELYGSIVSD